ncbi:8157_t:CDS:2, partial [Ambispora gerdemannii]
MHLEMSFIDFYATMSDIKSTLKIICDHTNNVSLSDSRLHRERKRKIPVYSEQSGLFGTPSSSPIKKVTNDLKSSEYSTPLPNKSCSNGENAQIKDSSTHHEVDQSITSTDSVTSEQ